MDALEPEYRDFYYEIIEAFVRDPGRDLLSGMEGLLEIATMPEAEILVTAIVGMLGIRPTIAAIEAGKAIALAGDAPLPVCVPNLRQTAILLPSLPAPCLPWWS